MGATRRRGVARRMPIVLMAAGAGLALVVAGSAALARSPAAPHEPVDAVPASLDLPWHWQATVQADPPGQAAILYGGDALRGIDFFDAEGKLAVVGRTGATRLLLYAGVDDITAGEDVHLSPDGRRVAQAFLPDSGTSADGMIITDLETGRSVTVPGSAGPGCCTPVAWAPDGNSLLATQSGDLTWIDGLGMADQRFVLLDLATGTSTVLGDYQPGHYVRMASRGAFAPDGAHLVLTEGSTVRLVDRSGATRWSRDLGPRRYLAGVGAFTPDGQRIVTVTLDGCLQDCDEAALADRTWRFTYLDATTGADTTGPELAPVTGMAVRALGWIQDRELAVLRYQPARGTEKRAAEGWDDTGWWETGHITLLGLGPGLTTRTVLEPPDGVLTLDVPADLLAAGRFDGPPSHASFTPVRTGVLLGYTAVSSVVWLPLAVLLVLVPTILVVRRRARRSATRVAGAPG